MLLSLMGIFVINIGLASKSNMENSFSSITHRNDEYIIYFYIVNNLFDNDE